MGGGKLRCLISRQGTKSVRNQEVKKSMITEFDELSDGSMNSPSHE